MRTATAAGDYRLPRLKDTRDHSQDAFLGAPTWVRRAVGAGQYERIRLERLGDTFEQIGVGLDAVSRRVQVWSVPAAAWSPRDHIEIGPLPPNVRIDFEVDDQYAMAAAFLPNARSWSTTRPLHNANT